MTEAYLSGLGFEQMAERSQATHQVGNNDSWRYQHTHAAQDGTHIYLEHPFLIDRYRLSQLPAPLDQADVLADLHLNDQAGLETALQEFFTAHGGLGELIPVPGATIFRPYRRGV